MWLRARARQGELAQVAAPPRLGRRADQPRGVALVLDEVVGDSRCPIADTWWQTETGAIMMRRCPPRAGTRCPAAATYPFFGVQPCCSTRRAPRSRRGPAEGLLAIKAPWPSTIRSVYGDHKRMEETYFPFDGYYLTGDGARRDAQGRYTITGRVDDVIIVSGHNIGTAEVESASSRARPSPRPRSITRGAHDVKGNALYCYVTLNEGEEETDESSLSLILDAHGRAHHELGAALRGARCATILGARRRRRHAQDARAAEDPRSGKIMRRVLRKIAEKGPRSTRRPTSATRARSPPSPSSTAHRRLPRALATPRPRRRRREAFDRRG